MLVVESERMGAVAFSRLVRDRIVHEVLGSRALPADVASTRELRAHLVAPFVPGSAWLTGLAALWVEGLCPAPARIDLAGRRGLHLKEVPAGALPVVVHTGPLVGLPAARHGMALAVPARACVDALAHCPAPLSLPATASALRTGAVTRGDLMAVLGAVNRHTAYRTRVAELIHALASL